MSNIEYRETITKRLLDYSKGNCHMNLTQIADFLGINRETAHNMMCDVPCWTNGRDKRYLVDEIAEKMVKSRKAS